MRVSIFAPRLTARLIGGRINGEIWDPGVLDSHTIAIDWALAGRAPTAT